MLSVQEALAPERVDHEGHGPRRGQTEGEEFTVMKSLRLKLVKALAWTFWKLRIITESDYVNLCLTLLASDAGLKIVEASIE